MHDRRACVDDALIASEAALFSAAPWAVPLPANGMANR